MKFIALTVFLGFTSLIESRIYSEIFPPISGAANADVYLYFAYPIRLPAHTIIRIQQAFALWQYSNSQITDYCWCNFDYISCQFTGSLEIQTSVEIPANKIIEIYLDSSLYLGGTNSGNYPGFIITALWLNVIITEDLDSSNIVTIKPAVPLAVRNWQIALDDITPGAISNYRFKFTSDADTNPGYQIVIGFDQKFNPWLCEPKNRNIGEKNDYSIKCSSDTLGDISCTAKHWYVIVTGINKAILANGNIDVKLEKLWTPSIGTFYMSFYILDANDEVKSFADPSPLVISNDNPSSFVDFKSMRISDNHLLNIAKYEFEFYVGSMYLQNYMIFVEFPQEYNLAKNPTLSCNVTYFDESAQNPSREIFWFFWNDNSNCTSYNSYIKISVPVRSPMQFTNNMRLKVAIDGILNPQRAYKNTGFTNWENINLVDNDYISGKFEIEIFDSGAVKSIAKSGRLFHSVYAGFKKTNKSFQFTSKAKSIIS